MFFSGDAFGMTSGKHVSSGNMSGANINGRFSTCRYYLLAIMVTFMFITGCVPIEPIVTLDRSTQCERIISPALLQVPFEELRQGQKQAESWIITQFPTATVEFELSELGGRDNIGWFYWSENEKHFVLSLMPSYRLIEQSSEQYPTLGHVLRCFGKPKYYSLTRTPIGGGPIGVRLELWYPNHGIRFRSETWGLTEIRRYDTESAIRGDVVIMPIGTVEDMLRNWGAGSEEYVQDQLALLRDWPDDVTEIVLEE